MIPVKSDIQIQGNLGDSLALGLDQNSLAHIMGLLTNLYSNKVLAVIRELSTNALDSHRAAGVTEPIQVHLPTVLHPFFEVVDFGLGMSVDDLTQTYAFYGSSTKRDSNDYNGVMGIGSKAPLTYTDQFTIEAIKNGLKVNAAVSRSEDGGGSLTISDTVVTDKPNGVKISVPVLPRDVHNFVNEAVRFFRVWDPRDVLIDAMPPKPLNGNRLSERIVIVPKGDNDYVVMGNVPYPITKHGPYRNHSVYYFVNMGEVEFAPSRESLRDTKNTNDTIKKLRNEFDVVVAKAGQAEVDAQITLLDKLKVAHKWHRDYRINLVVAGQTFNKSITYTHYAISANTARGHTVSPYETLTYSGDNIRSAIAYVHGFNKKKLSTIDRRKIKALFRDRPINELYITSEKVEFLTVFKTYEWQDIVNQKDPGAVVEEKDLRYSKATGGYILASQITGQVVLCNATDVRGRNLRGLNSYATIIVLRQDRHAAFLKRFPNALSLRDWAERLLIQKHAALTKADFDSVHNEEVAAWSRSWYDKVRIDPNRIDDPIISRWVQGHQATTPAMQEFESLWGQLRSLSKSFQYNQAKSSYVKDNYPLVYQMNVTTSNVEDFYFYLNEKYKKLKREGK